MFRLKKRFFEVHYTPDHRSRIVKSDIRTIAKRTGYSIATVSRVLRGTGYAASATRNKIIAEAVRLGRKTERKTIVFITVQGLFPSPYFMGLLLNLWEDFEGEGYRCELVTPNSLDVIEDRLVAGAIAILTTDGLEKYWGNSFSVPLVCINSRANRLDNIWSVLTDEYDGMKKLLDHLCELGHRRIMLLCKRPAEENEWCANARLEAFQTLAAEKGLEYAPEADIVYDESELPITAERIRRSGVTAVIVATEAMAGPLIWHLRISGCRVPEDLSVCGWDIGGARSEEKTVTGVGQDVRNLAKTAAARLKFLMSGGKISGNVLIPCLFYPRLSTASRKS